VCARHRHRSLVRSFVLCRPEQVIQRVHDPDSLSGRLGEHLQKAQGACVRVRACVRTCVRTCVHTCVRTCVRTYVLLVLCVRCEVRSAFCVVVAASVLACEKKKCVRLYALGLVCVVVDVPTLVPAASRYSASGPACVGAMKRSAISPPSPQPWRAGGGGACGAGGGMRVWGAGGRGEEHRNAREPAQAHNHHQKLTPCQQHFQLTRTEEPIVLFRPSAVLCVARPHFFFLLPPALRRRPSIRPCPRTGECLRHLASGRLLLHA
jgi:hypothetical protein